MKEPHKLRDSVMLHIWGEHRDNATGEPFVIESKEALKIADLCISTILKAVEDSLSVTTAHDVLNATKPYDALVYRASEVQEAIKELKEE